MPHMASEIFVYMWSIVVIWSVVGSSILCVKPLLVKKFVSKLSSWLSDLESILKSPRMIVWLICEGSSLN